MSTRSLSAEQDRLRARRAQLQQRLSPLVTKLTALAGQRSAALIADDDVAAAGIAKQIRSLQDEHDGLGAAVAQLDGDLAVVGEELGRVERATLLSGADAEAASTRAAFVAKRDAALELTHAFVEVTLPEAVREAEDAFQAAAKATARQAELRALYGTPADAPALVHWNQGSLFESRFDNEFVRGSAVYAALVKSLRG